MAGLGGDHEVSFCDLFPDHFMIKYTDFSSLDEMFKESGFVIESSEHFDEIPDREWDDFIKRRTRFPNWDEMLGIASEEWIMRQLEI